MTCKGAPHVEKDEDGFHCSLCNEGVMFCSGCGEAYHTVEFKEHEMCPECMVA